MVGNKADLVNQKQIKTEEAKKLAEVYILYIIYSKNEYPVIVQIKFHNVMTFISQEYSLPFAETSGKTGMNVEHVFRTIAQ